MTRVLRKLITGLVIAAIAALSFSPIAQARRVSFSKGYSGAPYTFGLTSANTSAFRGVVQAQARNAIIAVIDDSTGRGQTTGGGTSQFTNGWPVQLAAQLQAAGINAGANNLFGGGGQWGLALTMANVETGDSRVSHTGAWAVGANLTAGGANYQSTSAGSMTFTTNGAVTNFDFWWRNNTAGRSFTYQVDGGSTTQVNSTGADAAPMISITGLSQGTHALTFNWVLGTPVILGMSGYDATAGRKEISIWNWSVSGATSTQLVSTAFTASSMLTMLGTTAVPDLCLVEGAVINDWRTSIPVATSKANLTTIVLACKAAGANVILRVPTWDNANTGLSAQQATYMNAFYQVAAEQGVGLFDIRGRPGWTSYAAELAAGYASDSVHPTAAGYADIAAAWVPVIRAIINNTFAGYDDPVPLAPANDNQPVLFTGRRAA